MIGRSPNTRLTSAKVLETAPGDVIVFDEHLIHGSVGGSQRRQWRVDFVIDPRDEHEHAGVAAWFDQSIPDERHDPGYDAEALPELRAVLAGTRPALDRQAPRARRLPASLRKALVST